MFHVLIGIALMSFVCLDENEAVRQELARLREQAVDIRGQIAEAERTLNTLIDREQPLLEVARERAFTTRESQQALTKARNAHRSTQSDLSRLDTLIRIERRRLLDEFMRSDEVVGASAKIQTTRMNVADRERAILNDVKENAVYIALTEKIRDANKVLSSADDPEQRLQAAQSLLKLQAEQKAMEQSALQADTGYIALVHNYESANNAYRELIRTFEENIDEAESLMKLVSERQALSGKAQVQEKHLKAAADIHAKNEVELRWALGDVEAVRSRAAATRTRIGQLQKDLSRVEGAIRSRERALR